MKNNRIIYAAAAALPAAVLFYLFSGVTGGGKILFGHDFLNIYLPFKMFAKEALFKYGQLPLWMPGLFFGGPGIASSSVIFYYPTDFIYMFLPGGLHSYYSVDVIIHLLAAGAGMYLFLRASGLSRGASYFGAIVMMTAGYNVSYVQAGHINNIKAGALIPFAFFFTKKAIDGRSFFFAACAGIIMGLQITATGMQIMAYTALGILLYAAYSLFFEAGDSRGRMRALAVTGLIFAAAIAASLPQFVPSFEYKNESWRGNFSYEDFISWSLPPLESLQLLIPSLFGLMGRSYFGEWPINLNTYYFGILPLIFAVFAFMPGSGMKKAYFFAAASAVFLILSLGGYTPVYGVFREIPVFNQFRNPSRFMYVFTFMFTVLASAGLDNLMKAKQVTGTKVFFAGAGVLAVVSGILIWALSGAAQGMMGSVYMKTKQAAMPAAELAAVLSAARVDAAYGLFFAAAAAAAAALFLSGRVRNAALVFLVFAALAAADSARVQKKFIMPFDYDAYFPEVFPPAEAIKADGSRGRVADFGFMLGANRGMFYGFESAKGFHGLYPARFMRMEREGVFNSLHANRGMNMAYYASGTEMALPGFGKIYEGNGVKLYADSASLPLAYFTDRAVEVRDQEEAFQYLKSGAFVPGTAVCAEETGVRTDGGAPVKAVIEEYTPCRIKFRTEQAMPGLAVLNVSYSGNWRAEVNGKKTRVVQTNYNMMSVPVQAGRCSITFEYSAAKDIACLLISLIFTAWAAFLGVRGGHWEGLINRIKEAIISLKNGG